MAKHNLSERQQRFVEAYLKEPIAEKAALQAGYAKTTSRAAAHKILANVGIQAALEEARNKRAERVMITADRVLEEIAHIAFLDPAEILDFTGTEIKLKPASEISEQARRALASVKVKRTLDGRGEDSREVELTEFRFWDKLSALEKAAKHLGLFDEKTPLEQLLNGLDPDIREVIQEAVVNHLRSRNRAVGTGDGQPESQSGEQA